MAKLLERIVKMIEYVLEKLIKSADYKNQRDALRKLYSTIKEEIIGFDLGEFIRENIDIKESGRSIEIKRASKNKDKVYMLLQTLPGARVEYNWTALNEMVIKYDIYEYQKRINNKNQLLDKTVLKLKNIIDFYDTNSNDSFDVLLNKYGDTFHHLTSTIKELKESSKVDEENQKIIKEILQSFIDEFNSLTDVFGMREKIDKQAVNESIKRRLEDELEFVNRIKTDWNSSTL